MLIGQRVTVVGAGIGGLAAALALAQRGAQVEVLEQAPEIAEVGAGLQISPNGFAVLAALGLAERAEAAAVASQAVHLVDGSSGRRVLTLDLARHLPGQRFLLMHRADLIALLAEAAAEAGVTVKTGARVENVSEEQGCLRLYLGDGSTHDSGLAIAADGVRSRLRPLLNGTAEPFFTRQVAWRALVPAENAPAPEVEVHMGPGRHLVRYPLRGGRLINIVAVEERDGWADEGWHNLDDPANLRRAFEGFAPDVRALLDRVETVHLWGLVRHPVARRWSGPHVALLGDAAHPTLPFVAQGANLALEDAWVLADCYASLPPDQAGAVYQQRRRDRVVRTVDAATSNARNYHLSNPLIRAAAHTGLRLAGTLAPAAPLNRFAWLYGHDVTQAE